MDRVMNLTRIVRHEIAEYANVHGWKSKIFLLEDEKRQTYAVIAVPDYDYPMSLKAGVTVMAHLAGDKVVIDQDITDKPLYEALMGAGISREQIILAYAGEHLPAETQET